MSILITSVLNSAPDRWAISSLLSYFFWSFDLFFHLGHISLSWSACYVVRGRALGIHQGGATLFVILWHYLWGRSLKGNDATCWLCSSPTFCHFPHFPQVDGALSDADLKMGGFVYFLGPRGPLPQTLLWSSELLPLPQLLQIFTSRGFESVVSHAETLGSAFFLTSQLFFPAYWPMNVGLTGLPATSLVVSPLCLSCPSLPLLPVWMNVSLTPWLLDFHANDFLAALVVLCF